MYSGRTGTGTSVSFSLGNRDMAVVLVTTSGSQLPPTSTAASSQPPQSTQPPPQTTGGSGCQSEKWGQCGGQGWSGCTVCAAGSTCKYSNDWYSQCV
jgi:acetylxylan esterase